ncbi:phosphoglucosamine mutase [candidate division KSB1 bacterium]|nr:phosphoglucosamine mutase [candidate division KSB1 bacterium]
MVSESPLMVSVAGIRGIVGDSLTAEIALRWAEAFGSARRPGPVVVGGDSRVSKVMMRAATFAGLANSGCRIIDLGIVSTPTIQLAVEHHHARGGIAITASHNPLEWNALKFFNGDGFFLDEREGGELRKSVESKTAFGVRAGEIGTYEKDEQAVRRHVDAALRIPFLARERIVARRFRVGIDAVNGAGGEMLALLCAELGCDVVGFHVEPSGRFPRNPEPTTENLREVGREMHEARVEIGFVVDPDADRLALILENGRPAGEELTLACAVDTVLRYESGPVVVNCSTSRAVHDIAAKYGAACGETMVGEAHVSRGILANHAVIGGEGNGGVMYPAVHNARDSAVGVALTLQALLDAGRPASDYFASLPAYAMVKRKQEFSDLARLRSALAHVHAHSPFGEPGTLDGMKWTLPGSWAQIRASNTEPIVRIFAEARTEPEALRLVNTLIDLLNSAPR